MWNPSLIDGPVPMAEAGCHLNLPEALMSPALEPFRIAPLTPERVLAGEATAFLRFDDEAQALACAGLDGFRLPQP